MVAVGNRSQMNLHHEPEARSPQVFQCRTCESGDAIHHPRFHFDSDWFVSIRDKWESRFPLDQRVDDHAERVREAYAQGRASVWTQFTTSLALNEASGLGASERSVAHRLDLNRSVVNVALNHGDLGSLPLIDLMSNSFVLHHLFANHLSLRRLMGENGFINAAKCVAELNGVEPHAIPHMTFLQYRLLCQDIEIRTDDNWNRPLKPSEVAAMISSAAIPAVKLIPNALSKKHREAARELLQQLTDFQFAASYIRSLETQWIEMFVQTFAIVEGIGCDDLWEHD